MEAAIRFSQNSLPGQAEQYFLKVDIAGKVLQVYNIKKQGKHSLEHELVYASNKLPLFRAFDWHPTEAPLVAIGFTGGEASLVNLADVQQSPVAFGVRSQRSCNAVGLNTQNWIAVGLDKVRNDFCLNVWDVNQRTSGTSGKAYGKSSNEPLHKLAGGEPITSLRFFQDQPQVLAAGVKGQFIRLYDLREPTSSSALQFATRCVNNIAVDTQDENYFASCLPANNPTVSVWDRRMISRTNIAHVGFGAYINQSDQHPEASLELKDVVHPDGQIWGLRFSKTQRGCLGVLSSTGQLKILDFSTNESAFVSSQSEQQVAPSAWDKQQPQNLFLNNSHNFSNAYHEHPEVEEVKRIVSFDFTTNTTRYRQAKIITLTGDGSIDLHTVKNRRAIRDLTASAACLDEDSKVRRSNDTADSEATVLSQVAVLGPVNKNLRLLKRAGLHSTGYSSPHQVEWRCKAGYLLDAGKNKLICKDYGRLDLFWTWLAHAQRIAANGGLVQHNVDLSYLGIFGLWMEEVDSGLRVARRATAVGNSYIGVITRDLTRRLNLVRGKGCATEYPHHRALCLHVSGLPWAHNELEHECDMLAQQNEHTKAAAVALFGGEEKIAQKSLRAKGSGNSHKLLAMALLGARNRHRRIRRGSHSSTKSQDEASESDGSEDEEWQDIVSAVADDLTDCYARSILAFVKSGDWEDVVKQDCLPLRYKVNIALRHFTDTRLTRFLSTIKQEVTTSGNLEGIILTGLGTNESIELFKSYTRISNDVQTAALGMSFGAASDCFLPQDSTQIRTIVCFREAYRSQLMSLGLKFEKARFDVAVSKAVREAKASTSLRKKEQVKLVCTHCNQSLSQFGHDQQATEHNGHMTETAKHPLTAERAAVGGVTCPKCGRHLPRCGVCDMWLGTPDETFSRYYRSPSARNSNSIDLSASLVGSVVTAVGPTSNTPSVSITGPRGASNIKNIAKKLTAADLPPEVVEVVDKEVAQQDKDRQWYEAMHKFTVFCTVCSHGFHAEHAKMWFDGTDGRDGHRTCPVPLCDCLCNG